MANIFSFQMSEDFLTNYAAYLKQIREQNPGKSYMLTLSVDLIPDGIGYEITAPPQITIDEVTEKDKEKAEDTARRRSQGAKDGWEIRRGKQKG